MSLLFLAQLNLLNYLRRVILTDVSIKPRKFLFFLRVDALSTFGSPVFPPASFKYINSFFRLNLINTYVVMNRYLATFNIIFQFHKNELFLWRNDFYKKAEGYCNFLRLNKFFCKPYPNSNNNNNNTNSENSNNYINGNSMEL